MGFVMYDNYGFKIEMEIGGQFEIFKSNRLETKWQFVEIVLVCYR